MKGLSHFAGMHVNSDTEDRPTILVGSGTSSKVMAMIAKMDHGPILSLTHDEYLPDIEPQKLEFPKLTGKDLLQDPEKSKYHK